MAARAQPPPVHSTHLPICLPARQPTSFPPTHPLSRLPSPCVAVPRPRLQERARQVQAKHAAGAEGEFLETKKNTYGVVFMSINEPFRLVLSDVRARLGRTK